MQADVKTRRQENRHTEKPFENETKAISKRIEMLAKEKNGGKKREKN